MKWSITGIGELIFYCCWLLGSVLFLISASRDRSPKQEPFRRPALLLGSGLAALSAVAVITVLTGHITSSTTATRVQGWLLPAVLVLLVCGVILLWRGRRAALRAADAYPLGKHGSAVRSESLWDRLRR
jgi:cytochrome bd-type quinol oxidase subunit 2